MNESLNVLRLRNKVVNRNLEVETKFKNKNFLFFTIKTIYKFI
jgi:hypothetical protein